MNRLSVASESHPNGRQGCPHAGTSQLLFMQVQADSHLAATESKKPSFAF